MVTVNDDNPTPALIAQRAVLVAEVARTYGIALGSPVAHFALHPDTSWFIGRLYLAGQLTQAQRNAAQKLADVARRYEALLLAPKVPDSILLLEPRGLSTEAEDAYSRRFRRARAAYEALYDALSSAGADAHRAVTHALRDEHAGLRDLRKGLNALLTRERKGA